MKFKKNKFFNLNTASLLCALIVPLLVTGPFLPDFLLTSLSIWFIYYCFKHQKFSIFYNYYFYIFIIFWLICILSSVLSNNPFLSLKSSLFLIRIAVFSLLIVYLKNFNKKILNYFYFFLVTTFYILVIDGYFQYFTGFNFFGYKISGLNRVSSFFGEELILGSYLSRLFPLLFALFVVRKNKRYYELFAIFFLFILIDVLIFLSGERLAFFFLNLSSIFIIIFISKYKLLRLVTFLISFLIISFLIWNDASLLNKYIKDPLHFSNVKQVFTKNDNVDNKKIYFFSEAHDSMIKTAWNMFLHKPLLGHGPKSFREKCKDPKFAEGKFPCSTHPHNFYVQLLAETGFFSFLFLASLFIFLVYLIFKHSWIFIRYRKFLLSNYQICLLGGLLITIWPFSTNGNIFNNYLMIIYSLQIGFFRKDIDT